MLDVNIHVANIFKIIVDHYTLLENKNFYFGAGVFAMVMYFCYFYVVLPLTEVVIETAAAAGMRLANNTLPPI